MLLVNQPTKFLLLNNSLFSLLMGLDNKSSSWWQRNSKFVIPGVGIVLMVIVIYFTPTLDKTYINLMGIIGSSASIIALVMGIDQLRQIKRTSEETRNAVNLTIRKLKETLTLIDITRATGLVDQGIIFIKQSDIQMAYYKLKDLYSCLLSLKQIDNIPVVNVERTSQVINMLGLDVEILNKKFINSDLEVDLSIISTNLEKIGSYLAEIGIHIKYNRDGN